MSKHTKFHEDFLRWKNSMTPEQWKECQERIAYVEDHYWSKERERERRKSDEGNKDKVT